MKTGTVNAILGIGLVAVALAAWALDEPFIITLATKVAILALAAAGLNLALGHGGLVSFGHAAFFGIGGYAMGVLASHAQLYEPLFTVGGFAVEGTKSMPVIWLVAVVASGLAALGIGVMALRTGGLYFIMLTLAFAQMIYYFAISFPAYGGEDGLSIYMRNSFPGLNMLDPIQFFAICAALLFTVLFGLQKLVHSRFGLVLEASRQAPGRVVALGLEPQRVQLTAFVISGAITGLAGALYADLNRFVSPSMLAWQTSGELIVLVILGGTARLFGPLAGAALFIVLETWLGGISEFWQFYLGLLLLGVVLFARGGIIGWLAGERRFG